MIGFINEEEAGAGYSINYEPGWTGLGEIHGTTIDQFKYWLMNGNTKMKYKPGAAK